MENLESQDMIIILWAGLSHLLTTVEDRSQHTGQNRPENDPRQGCP